MLEPVATDPVALQLRAKAIVTVAGDLNIARRNWTAYPSGHPLVASSIQKLTESIRVLCKDGAVCLGATRDGLLYENDFIEKNNQLCKTVAVLLFERGIGVLVLHTQPSGEELSALLGLLALKREDIFAQGGIEKLWQDAGIKSLDVRPIYYDRFSGTEELHVSLETEGVMPADSLWKQFVQLLIQGEVGLSALDAQGDIRPEVLAATLNARFAQRTGVGSGLSLSSSSLHTTTSAVRQILSMYEDKGRHTASMPGSSSFDDHRHDVQRFNIKADLAAFISALDPVLRRQILNGFCETGQVDEARASELLRHVTANRLQETYATAEEYAAAPQVLQEILKKLLPHLINTYTTNSSDTEIHAKMHTLLQEHQSEAYMPDGYMQGLLDTLHADMFEQQLEVSDLTGMLNTLSPQFIDGRGSELIMQLVVAAPDEENCTDLIQGLADMCGHFLELGNYEQVLKVLSQAADPRLPQSVRSAMRSAFCRRSFMDEILSGLTIWGKPKYDQVSLLIQVLGQSFIEPLLDRMAEEENMSLRRFMMDRIQSFGASARPNLLARLTDHRWYVIRNIIIMLRTMASEQDFEHLRPLLRHPNQRVHSEALRLLIILGDPVAQRQLLRDLDSVDHETQLNAISMVNRDSQPEITQKLLVMLSGGGFSAVECELKSAAVQALGEMGKPEVLPDLAKILASRSLLAFKALNRIKLDIIRSFERYPAQITIPVLERLCGGGDDLARQAAESLKNLRSRAR